MKTRILTLFLLLAMSFSIGHAYVIEAFDTHPCQVSEYVHEIGDTTASATGEDICHLDHFFHIATILSEANFLFSRKSFAQQPHSNTKRYEYNSYNNFLKPPINA
ncbi:MAG: hypothetical protein FAF04_06695 [Epsilonproteobacteria bacterium]|nr:hypothetical protein [Campylobacterota bacterium]